MPDNGVHTLEPDAPAQCCALTVVEITDKQVKKITVSRCNLRSMSVVFVYPNITICQTNNYSLNYKLIKMLTNPPPKKAQRLINGVARKYIAANFAGQ